MYIHTYMYICILFRYMREKTDNKISLRICNYTPYILELVKIGENVYNAPEKIMKYSIGEILVDYSSYNNHKNFQSPKSWFQGTGSMICEYDTYVNIETLLQRQYDIVSNISTQNNDNKHTISSIDNQKNNNTISESMSPKNTQSENSSKDIMSISLIQEKNDKYLKNSPTTTDSICKSSISYKNDNQSENNIKDTISISTIPTKNNRQIKNSPISTDNISELSLNDNNSEIMNKNTFNISYINEKYKNYMFSIGMETYIEYKYSNLPINIKENTLFIKVLYINYSNCSIIGIQLYDTKDKILALNYNYHPINIILGIESRKYLDNILLKDTITKVDSTDILIEAIDYLISNSYKKNDTFVNSPEINKNKLDTPKSDSKNTNSDISRNDSKNTNNHYNNKNLKYYTKHSTQNHIWRISWETIPLHINDINYKRLRQMNTIDTGNWMRDTFWYNGYKSLTTLCVQGTHNSGMYKLYKRPFAPVVQEHHILNQQISIYKQLVEGVRFLDIRPTLINNNVYCGHYTYVNKLGYIGGCGILLQQVIDDINLFTSKDDRAECITILLSHGICLQKNDTLTTLWNNVSDILSKLNYRQQLSDDMLNTLQETYSTFKKINPNYDWKYLTDQVRIPLHILLNPTLQIPTKDTIFKSRVIVIVSGNLYLYSTSSIDKGIFDGDKYYKYFDKYSNTIYRSVMEKDQLDTLQTYKGIMKYINNDILLKNEILYKYINNTDIFLLSWFTTPPENLNVLFYSLRKEGRKAILQLFTTDFINKIVGYIEDSNDTAHAVSFIKALPNVLYLDSLQTGQCTVALACIINSLLIYPYEVIPNE